MPVVTKLPIYSSESYSHTWEMSATTYDCIVIGAGYAGLSAARALLDKGKWVLLLEARDRVGGRAWTKHLDDGSYEDYGAMFLGVEQPNMHRLAAEFNISVFDVTTKGKSVLTYRGRSKSYSPTGLPPLSAVSLLFLARAVRSFEELCKTVDLEEPWKTPRAHELDNQTIEQWIRANCWTKGARDTLRMAFELFWGLGTSQVSLLHALWYSKSGVSFTVLGTIDEGAQKELVIGGGQAIANALAKYLGSAVHLEEPGRARHRGSAPGQHTPSRVLPATAAAEDETSAEHADRPVLEDRRHVRLAVLAQQRASRRGHLPGRIHGADQRRVAARQSVWDASRFHCRVQGHGVP